MFPKYTFEPQFKRITKQSSTRYSFQTKHVAFTDESYASSEGALVGGTHIVSDETLWKLPQSCKSEEFTKHVLESWYADCKHVFVKPLQIETLLEKVQHTIDQTTEIPALTPEEDEQDWILLWTVIRIEIDTSSVTFYWAPTVKRPVQSRIEFEIQSPEDSQYRIIEHAKFQSNQDSSWVQDLNQLPLSDRPALRLEAEYNQSKEKLRRRVRDARLRAKLAKYRADRLAAQYLERYGLYPQEDEEEAQTEYESSSEDSANQG